VRSIRHTRDTASTGELNIQRREETAGGRRARHSRDMKGDRNVAITEGRLRAHKRANGEGTIRQRKDGRWCGVLNLGWENGHRKRKHFYGSSAVAVQEQLLKSQIGPLTRVARRY